MRRRARAARGRLVRSRREAGRGDHQGTALPKRRWRCRSSVCARVLQRSVGATIADHVADVDGGLIVMSTFGRGRSEAILGSVALDVLRAMDGPVVAVGPKANTVRADHRGELIVPVDGSAFSETVLPLAAALGTDLEARPWVVEVLDPDQARIDDAVESSHAARLAPRPDPPNTPRRPVRGPPQHASGPRDSRSSPRASKHR